MMKCFDTIYSDGLWPKLSQTGNKSRVLKILRNMYQQVKSCVKLRSSYSDFFHYAIALRQRKVMSPILFSLSVEDLELFLQKDTNCGLNINAIVFILLSFADDMAIIGKSPQELQQHLIFLHDYCGKWSLKVDISKTKIVVFRKRSRPTEAEKWNYAGQNIEVFDNFNYLGYPGSFVLNQAHLTGKTLKVLHFLICKCREFDLNPKVPCQLTDAFVGSVLSYAREI